MSKKKSHSIAPTEEMLDISLPAAKPSLQLPDVEALTHKQIAHLMKNKDVIKSWFTKAEQYMLVKMMQGDKFDGFKLVEGRSTRKWIDDPVFVAEKLREKGVNNPYKPVVPLGITEVEKILGKGKIDELTIKPPGAMKVVEGEDDREEIEFDIINND